LCPKIRNDLCYLFVIGPRSLNELKVLPWFDPVVKEY
jgi:hypothetical protein